MGNVGGEDGIRTRDPLIANQVLYQLSYIPSFFGRAKIQLFSLIKNNPSSFFRFILAKT